MARQDDEAPAGTGRSSVDSVGRGRVERVGEPVDPVGEPVDPRAVRVSVVGADLVEAPPPIIVAPGSAGGQPNHLPTIDGRPAKATLELLGRERAILRDGADDGPGVGDARDATRHRLLLPRPDPGSATAGGRPGIEHREVVVDGWRIEVEVESAARAALRDLARRGREESGHSGPTQVRAIIPGVVVSVSVAPGDVVTAGQQLLVVEAMKMQNELRSPRDGTIERVAVGTGARIDAGDLLLVLE